MGSTSGNSLLDLANAIKVLNPDPTKPLTTERLIVLVKELNELRGGNNQQPTASFHIDAEGNKQQLAPGEPIVVKWVQREPGVVMSITLRGSYYNGITGGVIAPS